MSMAAVTTLRRCCVRAPAPAAAAAVARLSTGAPRRSDHGLPTVIERHGSRQVIGYGYNGEPNYMDRVDYPIPAVRFREDTRQIMALREKERGDWKKLTTEEVQQLYRATFCQSFAEMQAPTGEWKAVLGGTLIVCAISIWCYLWLKVYVYGEMPDTITDPERVEAQVQRMIDLRVNPVEGLASQWDYDSGKWKK